MKKTFWIFIALILLAYGSVSADETAESLFNVAYDHYLAGDYEKAISEFISIIDSGLTSGNILYNIGNSYLKANKLGYAILSYERARLFIPRDSDLLSNYRYARTLIKQKEAQSKKSFVLAGLDTLFSYLTLKETYFIFMGVYYAIAALMIICIFIVPARRYILPFSGVLFILWIVIALPMAGKFDSVSSLGVMVSDIADARLEPSSRATANFPLYAGMRVRILSTMGDWRKVRRLDGKIGWVERGSVEPISEEAQKI